MGKHFQELLRIRSMFGFILILTASLTLFIIIVITCQQRSISSLHSSLSLATSLSTIKKAKPDPGGLDHDTPRPIRPLPNRSKTARSAQKLHPRFDKLFSLTRTRTQNAKAPSLFGVPDTFAFVKLGAKSAFEVDRLTSQSFQQMARKRAGKDGVIFLATVDSAYVTMALNLYLTSFAPLNITNYLFVGTESNACRLLQAELPVTCVRYFDDRDGNRSSDWGSASFRRKTHYKTKVILETLRLGLTAIIVDVDIVFFRNPTPYLGCTLCDIQIQSDVIEGNSGFYMARPTRAAIELHEKALTIGAFNPRLSNQKTLGKTIDWMNRQKRIRVRTLNQKLFPCGSRYFEDKGIMFVGDNRCIECVIVHNNWIVSQEAKIYRFQETGLWQVDTGSYYSDPDRKYLAYDNPIDFGFNKTLRPETEALQAALFIGFLLNRTVILPEFHCHGCQYGACKNRRRKCALNTFYKIADFSRIFGGRYREHVFLRHSKVPDSVKRSQSRPILIRTPSFAPSGAEKAILVAANNTNGPSAQDILAWFASGHFAEFAVLNFHSLYGIFPEIVYTGFLSGLSIGDGDDFSEERLSLAFKTTVYRQY